MKYIDMFLYFAGQYVNPTVSYFVLLGTALLALIALRYIINYTTKQLVRLHRRRKAIQRAKNRITERVRPVTDPWLNARDVNGHTDFEKTIRMKARGFEVE